MSAGAGPGAAGPLPLPAEVVDGELVLRWWRVDDVEAMADAVTASIEHLRPWMPWIAFEPQSLEDRRGVIEGWEADRRAGGDVVYGLWIGGALVGGIGLHRRIGPDALEIGYWVHVDHVGRGLAGRAARVLTDLALAVPGIDRVEIHHDPANVRSGRVPEKLGFTRVGEIEVEATAPGETGRRVVWRMERTRPTEP